MLKTNIKVNIDDIGGKVAKEDDRYIVKDNACSFPGCELI